MSTNYSKNIILSKELENKRIIITGCGYKPLKKIFYDITTKKPSHDEIKIKNQKMKLNIGSAIAKVLAEKNTTIHLISKTKEKLENLKNNLEHLTKKSTIEYSALDLSSNKEVKSFVRNLPRDKDIYWVQSVGLGAGSYNLKNNNPYLPLEKISTKLLEAESSIVLKSTHILMKNLLPIFYKQKETKIAIISSMSAIRSYGLGGTHCAAKGGIDRYTNAAMLELYKKNIFITTIRPGGVDTGMYDNEFVQSAIKNISKQYNGIYDKHFALAPPSSIGEIINTIFTTSAHIPSVNLVAKGQFPNEGS